jgi:hypothetical protein
VAIQDPASPRYWYPDGIIFFPEVVVHCGVSPAPHLAYDRYPLDPQLTVLGSE